jgi:hypothetical protein
MVVCIVYDAVSMTPTCTLITSSTSTIDQSVLVLNQIIKQSNKWPVLISFLLRRILSFVEDIHPILYRILHLSHGPTLSGTLVFLFRRENNIAIGVSVYQRSSEF